MGLSASLAAVILASVGHTTLYFLLRHYNAKRARMTEEEKAAEIAAGKTGDFHPDYRYAL